MLHRRVRGRLLCCLLVLGFVCGGVLAARAAPPTGGAGGTAPAADDWIRLDGGPNYAFTEPGGPFSPASDGSDHDRSDHDRSDLDTVTLFLPVALKPHNPQKSDLTARTMVVKPLNVSFNASANRSLFDAIRGRHDQDAPRFDDGNGRTGPAIEISLDLHRIAKQGTYAVSLEVSAPGYPPHTFTVQIVHAPAVVSAPASLVIDREIDVWGGAFLRTTPLLLQEQSGLSGLSPIVPVAKNFVDAQGAPLASSPTASAQTGGPTSETFSFPSLPARIPPNGAATLPYTLHGDFPWGTIKGTVEIRAPQIATVTIPVEIRTHRTPTWILILTAIGLVTGWLVRTYLQQRIQTNQTRLKAVTLTQRIALMIARHPDSLFVGTVTPQGDALKEALDANRAQFWTQITASDGPDPLVAAIQTADDALAKALTDLDNRRAAMKTALEAFSGLTQTPWLLPEGVRAALNAAQTRNATGPQALWTGEHIEAARLALITSRTTLIGDINNALSLWKSETMQRLQELSAPGDALPASVALSVKPLTAALTPLVNGVVPIAPALPQETKGGANPAKADAGAQGDAGNQTPVPDTNAIAAVLSAIHNVEINVRDMLREIAGWMQSVETDVVETLLDLKTALPDRQAVEALDTTAKQWIGSALAEAARSGPTLAPLEKHALHGLGTAWQQAIHKQCTALPADMQSRIQALLKKRQYSEAAQAVADGIRNPHPIRVQGQASLIGPLDLSTLLGGTTPTASFLTAWFARRESVAPSSMLSLPQRETALPTPIEVTRAQTLREIMIESLVQFILVGILITVVGYGLFADKFIGTITDMLGIFFWAFGLNITVDTLLTAAKPVKTPS